MASVTVGGGSAGSGVVGEWPLRAYRRDAAWLAATVVVTMLVLVPALTMSAALFFDEGPQQTIPKSIAKARALQNGAVPLWDPHTFAGAKPYYSDEPNCIFYPVLYPFWLAADVRDPQRAAYVLMVLPYVLHVIWGAIGGFLFARVGLGLHPAGGLVMGLLHGFSPEIATDLNLPEAAFVFAYLPWVTLAVFMFLKDGSKRWWIAGAVLAGLMNSVGYANYLIRIHVFLGLIIAATTVFQWRWSRRGGAVARGGTPRGTGFQDRFHAVAGPLGRPLATLAMLALGVGLSGVTWAGLLEGIVTVRRAFQFNYEFITLLNFEGSFHPRNLVTLFVPHWYGIPDGRHAWGLGLDLGLSNLTAIGGGMCAMAAVCVAATHWLERPGVDPRQRWIHAWCWMAVIAGLFFAVVIMGRFTPVFRLLCGALPWFFAFPHPIYYRFVVSWSIAVLASIGVSTLLEVPEARRHGGRWWIAVIPGGCLLAGAAVTLLSATRWENGWVRGYQQLTLLGDWGWFVLHPLAYGLGCLAFLVLLLWLIPERSRGWGLLVAVVIESVALAGNFLYLGTLGNQMRNPPDYVAVTSDPRFRDWCDLPGHGAAVAVGTLADVRGCRWVGMPATIDNQAWALDSRSFLGHPSKPLEPRFVAAIDPFCENFPYAPRIDTLPVQLFRNMNVGYLVFDRDIPPLLDASAEAGRFRIGEIPDPLPHIFFQDCVVAVPPAEQLQRLCYGDLRGAVHVDPDEAVGLPLLGPPDEGPADTGRFRALQESNRLVRVERHLPNRLTVEADVAEAGMLVIAECWHPGWEATIDGTPAPLRRVNYLQQGVWLEPGRQVVRLHFWPHVLTLGLLVSGLSALILALVAVVAPGHGRGAAGDS